MSWGRHLREFFKSRYARGLEDEVARLRIENRAMMNSILSIAGLPPLRLDAGVAREKHRTEIEKKARHSGPPAIGQKPAASGHGPGESREQRNSMVAGVSEGPMPTAVGQGIALPANAHRRRSWQQINRILEIEEIRQITNRDNSDAMQPRRG
jgi:hypothetical protein